MNVLQTLITVRGDEQIERAIAAEINADNDVPESFLDEMSTQYVHSPVKTMTINKDSDEDK